MKIQVLGSGCATCKKLFDSTRQVVAEMDNDFQVEYLTGAEGIQRIFELGAMGSPVLAVNDQVAMIGFTPDLEKIKQAIQEHQS